MWPYSKQGPDFKGMVTSPNAVRASMIMVIMDNHCTILMGYREIL